MPPIAVPLSDPAAANAPPGTPAIEVRDLEMAYGSHAVLRGVDLTIPHGEIFALLGPNGAGKTTMVEILEGFREPIGGSARVLGEDPAKAGAAWRTRVGLVLQAWTDHASWRVGDLVGHIGRHYPNPRPVDEVLRLVQLEAETEKNVGSLSGGQRRRLDVALGIIGRPDVLFLDEPTTGFDPEVRRGFWTLVQSLAADGTTILLTTHYLDEAEFLAARIGILLGGRLQALGTPEELAAQARTEAEVRWTEDGRTRVERTDDPSQLVFDLHQRATAPIPGLEVTRPTLEDTYLQMVAEHHRESGASAETGPEEVAA
jgi:ABC-2 type transport system ATP-binding protein